MRLSERYERYLSGPSTKTHQNAASFKYVHENGELQRDAALSGVIRSDILLDGMLKREANILMLSNLDAARFLFNVFKKVGGHGVTVGPILLGVADTAHVLIPSARVRRVVNMTALSAAARPNA